MIRIEDLRFSYGPEFSLEVPQLSIAPAERVAVIGPSGSGKTTLLHLIAGIATPSTGRVWADDEEVTALDDAARRDLRAGRVGLVFQEFELIEHLNVLDNVLLTYRINGSLRLERPVRDRAVELARRVGIDDKLHRRPGELSQGERQRVAVCRALVTEPRLVLADEPTGNLDPANKRRVLDILLEYGQRSHATLLTVTHDHELLKSFPRVIDASEFQASAEASS